MQNLNQSYEHIQIDRLYFNKNPVKVLTSKIIKLI